MKFIVPFFCAALLTLGTTAKAKNVTVHDIDIIPETTTNDMPMGRGEGNTSLLPEDALPTTTESDLFGTPGGGYFHPFLSIGESYTDNLYNVDNNHTSNILTTISPGIWLSLPRRKEIPLHIAPNNSSAGGLQAALPEYDGFDRYNAYLLGSLNYKIYSESSDLNDFEAILEGLFKYNLRSGISFNLVDRFTRSQDRFDVGNATASRLRQFNSNLAMANTEWQFTDRLRAKLEYTNFFLDYKDTIDAFMNRIDNTYSAYIFMDYSVKTSLFLQYQFVQVNYDTSATKDNDQDYFYGGINWVTSTKTAFRFKAGYQQKSYKDAATEDTVAATSGIDNNAVALELAFQYKPTAKTGITIGASHKIDESDSAIALNKKVTAGTLRYQQEFSDRVQGLIDLRYENADYGQLLGTRNDYRYVARPALQYVFRDWLMAEISYQYDTRNSSDNLYDYDSNSFFLSLNSAL